MNTIVHIIIRRPVNIFYSDHRRLFLRIARKKSSGNTVIILVSCFLNAERTESGGPEWTPKSDTIRRPRWSKWNSSWTKALWLPSPPTTVYTYGISDKKEPTSSTVWNFNARGKGQHNTVFQWYYHIVSNAIYHTVCCTPREINRLAVTIHVQSRRVRFSSFRCVPAKKQKKKPLRFTNNTVLFEHRIVDVSYFVKFR